MDSFNDRMYMEAFSRGGYGKHVGDFVAYMYWEEGRFISYANIVTDCVVEIELLNVTTGYYDVLGTVRRDTYLGKSDILDGMSRMVFDKIHLYI